MFTGLSLKKFFISRMMGQYANNRVIISFEDQKLYSPESVTSLEVEKVSELVITLNPSSRCSFSKYAS